MPALAAPAIVFNKAGVTREQFVADYSECDELAGGVRRPTYIVVSSNPIAAAAGSFFAGFLRSAEQRGLMRNVLRTCMADKGYRRIQIGKDAEKRIRALKDAEREEAMFQFASAAQVEGKVLAP